MRQAGSPTSRWRAHSFPGTHSFTGLSTEGHWKGLCGVFPALLPGGLAGGLEDQVAGLEVAPPSTYPRAPCLSSTRQHSPGEPA